jgi:hypothetical protein
VPDYELDRWTTTLSGSVDAAAVMALYADCGTNEVTRTPPGKFDTNALMCRLAALVMNILRQIG